MRDSAAWDALAPTYHEDVLTPFTPGIAFRLPRDLDSQLAAWRQTGSLGSRVVVDFGCGTGDGMLLCAGRVGLVAGLDYSPGMLAEAESRCASLDEECDVSRCTPAEFARLARKLRRAGRRRSTDGRPRVRLVRGDLCELNALRHCADLSLSLNSICPATTSEAHRMFGEVCRSVRRGGLAIFVLPAFDSTEYLFALARRHGDSLAHLGAIDADEGILHYADGEPQKHLRPEEISRFAAEAGMDVELLEKIRYPWDQMQEAGWGYYPGRERLWDWYLRLRA